MKRMQAIVATILLFACTVIAEENDSSRAVYLRFVGPPDQSFIAPKPPRTQRVVFIRERVIEGRPQRQRNPQVTPEHLLVIALDDSESELVREIIPDPRMVRAEFVDSRGRFRSNRWYNSSVEFSVLLPNNSAIVELELYHPEWTGETYDMQLVGRTQLR